MIATAQLTPLVTALRADQHVGQRRDFPCGTLLPDGRLDLCKQTIGPAGAEIVVSALKHSSQVRHLLMGADRVGASGAAAVASLVAERESLQTVYLGCNGIGPKGAQSLAQALTTNRSVTGLWLKRNGIGDEGAEHLAQMLTVNQTLRTLDLVDNDLTARGLLAIVAAVAKHPSIRHLYLCANALGSAGCAALEPILHADTLDALFLSTNLIGDEGVVQLCAGLRANRRLRVLGLSSNGIGPAGARVLVDTLKTHPQLEVLDLGWAPATDILGVASNRVGDQGAACLAELLQVHPTLRELNLAGNNITEAVARQLVEALQQPTRLHKLNLGMRLPQPLGGQLVSRLCRNVSQFPRGARSALERDLAAVRSVYRSASAAASKDHRPPAKPTDSRREVAPLDERQLAQALGCSQQELETCRRVLEKLRVRRQLLVGAGGEISHLKSLMIQILRTERRGQRGANQTRKARRHRDRKRLEQTGLRQLRREMRDSQQPDYDALVHRLPEAAAGAGASLLEHPRHCYICKRSYRQLHHFYDSLCPPCAAENYSRRTATADLRGRVALVTGGRIKIGYQVVLKLLRAGAEVHATTRFPHDAARRYAHEPDFGEFADRLHLHRLDLRDLPFVEAFANHLARALPRLDILINNAAQTVLKPSAFYEHLRAFEQQPVAGLPAELRPLVADRAGIEPAALPGAGSWLSTVEGATELFPPGSNDGHGQPLDLRTRNSWRLRAHEVTTPELLEVHLINSVAPFLLVSRLRQRLADTPGDAFVVNVSAVEGQFARGFKSVFHPHTNMAKAGLNMLTRTSARDYAEDRIFMNSVDTGWITNENPYPIIQRMSESGFETPIDEIDAAARICDPIFSGVCSGEPTFGGFLKDYRVVPW